ncbi:hypothetical protein SH661x_000421 [Planctomicrobium sp. SH661]|uniref:hypothetical protein n=1 Tax=Planctomicrobium sp. SH661 TaxID=3448124 RepID=UPI003F5C7982
MYIIKVKGNWQSPVFRRTVQTPDGPKLCEFTKDEPLEVSEDIFQQLQTDIGRALVLVRADHGGALREVREDAPSETPSIEPKAPKKPKAPKAKE